MGLLEALRAAKASNPPIATRAIRTPAAESIGAALSCDVVLRRHTNVLQTSVSHASPTRHALKGTRERAVDVDPSARAPTGTSAKAAPARGWKASAAPRAAGRTSAPTQTATSAPTALR